MVAIIVINHDTTLISDDINHDLLDQACSKIFSLTAYKVRPAPDDPPGKGEAPACPYKAGAYV